MAVAKFLFETSFAAPEPAPRTAAPPPPPPVLFSAEELETAKRMAHAEGYAVGREEVRSETEIVAASALKEAAKQLAAYQTAVAAVSETVRRDATNVALAVAEKLAPALMRHQPTAEIEAMLLDCLADLHEEPRVAVRVAEELVAPLADRVATLAEKSGFAGTVVLIPDEAMSGSDCRIEWADGGAERAGSTLQARIAGLVEHYMQGRVQMTASKE